MKHTPWIHAAGLAATGAFAVLAWQSREEGPVPLTVLWGVLAVAWAALAAAWMLSGKMDARRAAFALWPWAVAMRLCGMAGAPLLEDDWARYLLRRARVSADGQPVRSRPPRSSLATTPCRSTTSACSTK